MSKIKNWKKVEEGYENPDWYTIRYQHISGRELIISEENGYWTLGEYTASGQPYEDMQQNHSSKEQARQTAIKYMKATA